MRIIAFAHERRKPARWPAPRSRRNHDDRGLRGSWAGAFGSGLPGQGSPAAVSQPVDIQRRRVVTLRHGETTHGTSQVPQEVSAL
jgi:hypothetical protein